MRGMAEAAMKTEKFEVNLVEVEDKVKVTLKIERLPPSYCFYTPLAPLE